VDERTKEQHAKEQIEVIANRVSISVRGDQIFGEPLLITLTLKEPDIRVVYVDLLNEVKALFASSPCIQEGPLVFKTSVDGVIARRWFDGGKAEGDVDRKRLVIRATLLFGEREAHRDFAVYLRSALTNVGHGRAPVLHLEGDC
jgi:hypothetical protein